ncbi:hypothetical protein ACFYWN_40805 [Streptomyces sp. NPDC002917]|uniref:hypothetical protein n=1 Tax=unclassified Streptomyces TaxID=2593676 RepID=UPI00339E520C|nr:hypothetical protein OG955_03070 [Streptomyces sp. NBC_01602]
MHAQENADAQGSGAGAAITDQVPLWTTALRSLRAGKVGLLDGQGRAVSSP